MVRTINITLGALQSAQAEDLEVEQGALFRLVVNITPPAEGAGWTLTDTATAARMQARRRVENSETLLDLDSEIGGAITIDNNVDGSVTLTVEVGATDTEAFDWGEPSPTTDSEPSKFRRAGIGVYDLEVELFDDPDVVYRVLEGAIVLSNEVTR